MLRVAFVTQGAHVPAARFRVEQLVPSLAPHIDCTLLPASPSVYGDLESGKLHGHWRALARPFSVLSRLRQLSAITSHDVVWLQRPMIQYGFTGFERYVAYKRPTVFDFDDAIFHGSWGLDRFKVRRIIKAAHHVVVQNAYLAKFVDDATKTTIIPTVVDDQRYSPRPDPGDTQFTIVWTGLSNNLKEFEPHANAIRRVLAETKGRLVILADRLDAPFLDGMDVEFVKWSPDVEVSALGAGHVGVMPLADTKYNRGKGGFKLIQYMARAIPVVASPTGVNSTIVRDGTDGFIARSENEWVESLVTLARDADLRRRMGESGRKRIEETYSVRAVVPRYLEVLAKVTS